MKTRQASIPKMIIILALWITWILLSLGCTNGTGHIVRDSDIPNGCQQTAAMNYEARHKQNIKEGHPKRFNDILYTVWATPNPDGVSGHAIHIFEHKGYIYQSDPTASSYPFQGPIKIGKQGDSLRSLLSHTVYGDRPTVAALLFHRDLLGQ